MCASNSASSKSPEHPTMIKEKLFGYLIREKFRTDDSQRLILDIFTVLR